MALKDKPDCPACFAAVRKQAEHVCTGACRPPIHTGGGTIGDTPESVASIVAAADNLHGLRCVALEDIPEAS